MDKPYKCEAEKCGKCYATKSGLTLHSKWHEGIKDFKCKVCDKEFLCSSNLNSHLRTHTQEKYECNLCPASYSRKNNLKKHSATHDPNYKAERKFKCDECDRGFCSKQYLEIHSNLHSSIKEYTYAECGKVFLSTRNLKRHCQAHADLGKYRKPAEVKSLREVIPPYLISLLKIPRILLNRI